MGRFIRNDQRIYEKIRAEATGGTSPSAPALLCSFGDEQLLHEDESIYRTARFEVETAEFVGIEDFSRFIEGKQFTVVPASGRGGRGAGSSSPPLTLPPFVA